MFKENFNIDKGVKLFLYGDNEISRKAEKGMSFDGYSVYGIIDLKYSDLEVSEDGFIRAGIEHLFHVIDKEEYAIIVCLNDGSKHDEIKDTLVQRGYNKILYLPLTCRLPVNVQLNLILKYNYFVRGLYSKLTMIPYSRLNRYDNTNICIVDINEKFVTFWCHRDNLYVASSDYLKNSSKNIDWKLAKYGGLNIGANKPYIELFNYLLYYEKYPSEYLKIQRDSLKEQKLLLENRRRLVKQFEFHYEYDINFFAASASMAVYREEGGFFIIDGLHRATYLLCKGKLLIPICVSVKDFKLFEKSLME